MITGDVVFLDTETTGLRMYDEVWEVAAIRRRPDGSESSLLMQVNHQRRLAEQLPEKFRRDYEARFERSAAASIPEAGGRITDFLTGKPHLVGVNPAFDAAVLGRLFYQWDPWLDIPWHYHLIDLPAVTAGYLLAKGEQVQLPYGSDDLAARVGAPTTDQDGGSIYARHTAMGDVRWTRDWFDALNRLEARGTHSVYLCGDCGEKWTYRNTPEGDAALAETNAAHGGHLRRVPS